MNTHAHYSMLIEWSDEDGAYVVTLPEWAHRVLMPVTHGDSYEEAVMHGREVLEMLEASARQQGESVPEPRTHQGGSRDVAHHQYV